MDLRTNLNLLEEGFEENEEKLSIPRRILAGIF